MLNIENVVLNTYNNMESKYYPPMEGSWEARDIYFNKNPDNDSVKYVQYHNELAPYISCSSCERSLRYNSCRKLDHMICVQCGCLCIDCLEHRWDDDYGLCLRLKWEKKNLINNDTNVCLWCEHRIVADTKQSIPNTIPNIQNIILSYLNSTEQVFEDVVYQKQHVLVCCDECGEQEAVPRKDVVDTYKCLTCKKDHKMIKEYEKTTSKLHVRMRNRYVREKTNKEASKIISDYIGDSCAIWFPDLL